MTCRPPCVLVSLSSTPFWADPDFSGWNSGDVISACASSSLDPDQIVLTISGEPRPVEVWRDDILAAVDTARGRHPGLERVVLQPVVGGPDHALCAAPGEQEDT